MELKQLITLHTKYEKAEQKFDEAIEKHGASILNKIRKYKDGFSFKLKGKRIVWEVVDADLEFKNGKPNVIYSCRGGKYFNTVPESEIDEGIHVKK